MSPEQENLIRGLKAFGCDRMQAMVIMARLDSLEKVEKMRRYMVENPQSLQTELYEMSSKISSRRGNPPEIQE